jgi:hypothetical protein
LSWTEFSLASERQRTVGSSALAITAGASAASNRHGRSVSDTSCRNAQDYRKYAVPAAVIRTDTRAQAHTHTLRAYTLQYVRSLSRAHKPSRSTAPSASARTIPRPPPSPPLPLAGPVPVGPRPAAFLCQGQLLPISGMIVVLGTSADLSHRNQARLLKSGTASNIKHYAHSFESSVWAPLPGWGATTKVESVC